MSSGNWAKRRDVRPLLVSVAIATTRVIVRDRESPILEYEARSAEGVSQRGRVSKLYS